MREGADAAGGDYLLPLGRRGYFVELRGDCRTLHRAVDLDCGAEEALDAALG